MQILRSSNKVHKILKVVCINRSINFLCVMHFVVQFPKPKTRLFKVVTPHTVRMRPDLETDINIFMAILTLGVAETIVHGK